MVPTRTSPPDKLGEAKCGSGPPSLIWCRTFPVRAASWYSVPEFQSATQTAPPPMTGEPHAAVGPCQSTLIFRCAVLTAVRPPPLQGTETVVPGTGAPP